MVRMGWLVGFMLLVGFQLDYHRRHPIGYNATRVSHWEDQGGFFVAKTLSEVGVDGAPIGRVVADTRNIQLLSMYIGPEDAPLVSFDTGADWRLKDISDYVSGDLVYLNYRRLKQNRKKYYKEPIPAFILDPPPAWKEVWSADRVTLRYVTSALTTRPYLEREQLSSLISAQPLTESASRIAPLEASDGSVRFESDGTPGSDGLRLQLGPQAFGSKPPCSGDTAALCVDRPMTLQIGMWLSLQGDVEIGSPRLVRFVDNEPQAIEQTLVMYREGDRVHIGKVITLDPAAGDEAFNILAEFGGSGSITIEEIEILEIIRETDS
jgi:hypothetical protein